MKETILAIVSFSGVAICMSAACVMAANGHEYLSALAVVLAALCIPNHTRIK